MDLEKEIIQERIKKMEVNEFLDEEFVRAGYVDVNIIKTPIGVRVIIYTERPSLVIGRRGTRIKEIAKKLESKFKLENPQIDVVQIQDPDLNAKVVAYHIARALARGVRYSRAAFIALRRIMAAGALGAEVIISGKLTSQRARFAKFRRGIILKSGHPREKLVDEAIVHVLLKPGIYGVKVRILKQLTKFPGRITIKVTEAEKNA